MPRPNHWDLIADDPNRAIAFYSNVFGWKFQKWDGPADYWMFSTGADEPGIDGGLGRRRTSEGVSSNVIGVPDIDAYGASVMANGGAVVSEKGAVPGIGWIAYYTDPEGNQFGIMQFDPGAR